MLEVRDLSLSFPNRQLLRDVNFNIGSGEIVTLVGPSGSGKTTLLQSVAGIVAINTGNISIDGSDLSLMTYDERAKFRLQNVGLVFQGGELIPELNVLDNVALPARFIGLKTRSAKERSKEILGRVGLEDLAESPIQKLSGGEIMRVAIARAMVNNPKIILADEPTGQLDELNTVRIMELFREIAFLNNASFLIVTHDNTVSAAADRSMNISEYSVLC